MATVTVVIVIININALNSTHNLLIWNTKIKHSKESRLDSPFTSFALKATPVVSNEMVHFSYPCLLQSPLMSKCPGVCVLLLTYALGCHLHI